MEGIKMTYHGLDSRGDGTYYCPKCGKGGSYMGIIREEDTPRCYKELCNIKSDKNDSGTRKTD